MAKGNKYLPMKLHNLFYPSLVDIAHHCPRLRALVLLSIDASGLVEWDLSHPASPHGFQELRSQMTVEDARLYTDLSPFAKVLE
ncbi:hypothetical protein A0H81_06367 [Grifola frondosa]|uniref:Uncharacterized protein n=1 Tax=Grifola frondosa TaxID=5627 RepID=A0A1C7MB00_GRIFR|nr:hypothetical protein A0H81_06367 [Grifola frondosa]